MWIDGEIQLVDDTGYSILTWVGGGNGTNICDGCTISRPGEYFFTVNFKGASAGGKLEVFEAGRHPSYYKPIESIEDAVDRGRREENPDEVSAYLRYLWRKHGRDSEWVNQLISPQLLKSRTRPAAVIGGPIAVEFPPLFGPDSCGELGLKCERGVRLDGKTLLRHDGFDLGNRKPRTDTCFARDSIGSHTLQTYIKVRCLENQDSQRELWQREWLGPATEIVIADKLPDGMLMPVSSPELDAQMRSCIEIADDQSRFAAGNSRWYVRLIKPLPIALAAREYVSVDGGLPVPVYPDEDSRGVEGLVYHGTEMDSFDRTVWHRFQCDRELKRPGKHTVVWILKPDPRAALKSVDGQQYWAGEYRTPELEYEVR